MIVTKEIKWLESQEESRWEREGDLGDGCGNVVLAVACWSKSQIKEFCLVCLENVKNVFNVQRI